MKRFAVLVSVLLIALAFAEAAPKEPKPPKVLPPRIVRCNDKNYPSCFHKEFTCPAACSRNCTANCITCQASCGPKPPKVLPPRIVRCNDYHYPSCFRKEFTCPAACSRNCTANCITCEPTCGPPPPKQKLVKCKDHKTYNACSKIQQLCPLSCARTCTVDCKTCQPVCDPVSPVYSPPPPPYTPPTPYTPPPTDTPSPPPSSGVSPKHFARCMNKNYTQCYQRKLTCPPACSESCHVDCVTCSPICSCDQPGTVCQDPKFIGADGLTFYFHGKKEQNFCLLTDSNLHINAHFIGKRNADMGRDFTWVQSLGILFDNHQLYLGAKKTATWNDALDHLSLSFNGQPINLDEADGATWHSSNGLTITRSKATNAVEIEAENKFKIKAVVVPITEKESMIHNYGITQEDCFAHLDLSFKFYSLSGNVNGVLGQTYASNYVSRVKMGIEMPVLGGEKEFHSSGLFTTDCAVNKFVGQGIDEEFSQGMEFADLNCASGINGRGVVCKKR